MNGNISSSSNKKPKKRGPSSASYVLDSDIASVSHVLISGLGGVGAQAAKCLVLSGIKFLTLQDNKQVETWDLTGNPFLNEADIGENRAAACASGLRSLNTNVHIDVLTSSLSSPQQLSSFQLVVLTANICTSEAIAFSDYCHTRTPPIYFIMAQVNGLSGRIFCDFGPQFQWDLPMPIPSCLQYYPDDSLLTYCGNPDLDTNNFVFNGKKVGLAIGIPKMPIQNLQARLPKCENSKKDGLDRPKEQRKVLCFKTLGDALELEDPSDVIIGANTTDSAQQQLQVHHIAFRALDMFVEQRGCLPSLGAWKDNAHYCHLALEMVNRSPSLDATKILPFLQQFASGARAIIGPMASVIGGMVGHEVIKALSGVARPIFQFFYFDSLESLPSQWYSEDAAQPHTRYDAQSFLFGHDLQKKLEQAKLVVVGDGVLGCEVMGNLALMGACSGTRGNLVLTHRLPEQARLLHMDVKTPLSVHPRSPKCKEILRTRSLHQVNRISYLGRQTIFEDCYEEQCLPAVATASAHSVNRNLKIRALNYLKCKSGFLYEDSFWEGLDTIIDATNDLNSIHRRVSPISKRFLKPYLYPWVAGAELDSIAVVPAHRFTHRVAHKFPSVLRSPNVNCVRSEFEGLFVETPRYVNMLLVQHDAFISTLRFSSDAQRPLSPEIIGIPSDAQSREILQCVIDCLDVEWCGSFKDCINWARMRFDVYFVHLVTCFLKSVEELNVESRKKHIIFDPFSGGRRILKPLVFSASNVEHQKFLKSAAVLRAKTFGIKVPISVDWVKEVESVQDLSHNKVVDKQEDSDVTTLESLLCRVEELVENLPSGFQMTPVPFDADDNYHIAFATSMFDLLLESSANDFKVNEHRAKEVFGSCFPPPFPTSCTVAAGLTCLKLYKLIGGGSGAEKELQNVECCLDSPCLLKSSAIEVAD